MATRTYDGTYEGGVSAADGAESMRVGYRDVGATTFLWVAWTLAFVFWAFFMSTFFGILHDIAAGGPGSIRGGVDTGGAAYVFMDVIAGMVILGLVLLYGLGRYLTRDRAAPR